MAETEKQTQNKRDIGQQLQRTEPKTEIARTEGTPLARRDPFELMSEFMRRDPFRSDWLWRDPVREMRELMRDFGTGFPESRERAWRPDFEVRETDDAYIVTGDVPGLAADDLDLTVSGNTLEISGKREQKEEKEQGGYRTYERAYGSFLRTFAIPDEVAADQIQSKLDSGVLEVVLPKKPEAKQPKRKIAIKSRGESH